MKVQPFLLPASLNLMAAQRLVPRLCPSCQIAQEVSAEFKEIINKELGKLPIETKSALSFKEPYKIFHAPGCNVCKGKGIVGRMALFEILKMTPELETVINSKPSESSILAEAKRQGMVTLRQDGIIKALQGFVSLEEVLRETTEM